MMKKTTVRLKYVALPALALILLGGCGRGEQAADAFKPQAVKVKLATLEAKTVADSTEYVASLQSRRSVTLQPRVEGQVTRISVTPGDSVATGTPLLLIDPAKQSAAVNSSAAAAASSRADRDSVRATMMTYEADRRAKEADLKFNQQQYERYTTLYSQGAISKQDLDRFANSLEAARANLDVVNAQIQAQKAAISRADKIWQQSRASTQEQRVELQYYSITAPFVGTVGDIPVKVGDFVDKDTKLITVTQNNPLEVNLSIPIDRALDVKVGTQIQLLNAQGKPVGTSRVFFVSPNVDTANQAVLVKALFNNPGNKLRANQFIRAQVIWEKRPGLLLPTTAVSRIAGQDFVFVATSEPGSNSLVAKQKLVKLGAIQGNDYQVLEGLKPGEKVVVSGLLNLQDNAPIAPETEASSAPGAK